MPLRRQIGRATAGIGGILLCVAVASGSALHQRHYASEEVRPGSGGIAVAMSPLIRVPTPRAAAQPFGGYTPSQIRAAYDVNQLFRSDVDGKGTSIVIVDSFGSPTIGGDLGVFDRQFGLAAASLMIIHPAGRIPTFNPSNQTMVSWAYETTLDVEWAHVMAPQARIVLVETPNSENEGTSGFPDIVKAEKYVIAHHLGGVISQSFGATEQTFPKGSVWPLRTAYIEAAEPTHDITVLAASGDDGATDLQTNMSLLYTHRVTDWPASDPLVTGVGGLDLNLDSAGRRVTPDHVWNDPGVPVAGGASGGGLSIFFKRPVFQNGVKTVVGDRRGVPDVSLSASCSHPVDIYESFDGGGWSNICGTSEATPLLAGIVALADQVAGRPIGPINKFLYELAARHDRGIADITRGDNTVSFDQDGKSYTVRGWNAVRGYDLSSGVGTVDARWFVPELAELAKKAHQ
jgi:subtilase family serine protease